MQSKPKPPRRALSRAHDYGLRRKAEALASSAAFAVLERTRMPPPLVVSILVGEVRARVRIEWWDGKDWV